MAPFCQQLSPLLWCLCQSVLPGSCEERSQGRHQPTSQGLRPPHQLHAACQRCFPQLPHHPLDPLLWPCACPPRASDPKCSCRLDACSQEHQSNSILGRTCFKLTSVYKGSMVTMVYVSSFLVALYATTFNYIIFIHIFHDFQDKMVWMSWMMAVQGWILPGVILLFSNIAYLVAIWLNERQNKKSGLVAPSGWKLWIAAYGFLITLLFISSTAGSMLAHPIHQEVLSESNLTATSSKTLSNLTSLHSILLNTLLSILNPLLSFICLEKYRGNCVDLMNLWQRKVINYFN